MKRLFNKRFWAVVMVMLMMIQVFPLSAAAAESPTDPAEEPAAEVTLRYDLNGGEGEIESVTAAVGTEITVAAAPSREGYTFTGWLSGEKTYQPGDPLALTDDITLVAQWDINVYTVTYVDGFGSTLHEEKVEYGAAAQGYGETPTHEGYTFTGWDKELPEKITGDVTITAQWDINVYTVKYVDGFGSTLHEEKVEHGAAAQGYSETPTHEGYIFTGWDKELPEKITGDVTITAQWTAVYKITYMPLDPDIAEWKKSNENWNPAICPEGESAQISIYFASPEVFEENGAVLSALVVSDTEGNVLLERTTDITGFVGFDRPYRSGDDYVYYLSFLMPAQDVVVSARWKQATLTFDAGFEGGEAPETVTANAGSKQTLPAGPERAGYRFTGWQAEDGTVYPAGGTLILKGDITLTAGWEENIVTLHFDGNGGTTSKTDDVGAANRKVTVKIYQNDATREGYQFLGWNTDKDAKDGDPVLFKGGNVTWPKTKTVELGEEDVTLYAIWGENFTLTLDDNGAGLSGWPKTATGTYVRGITTKPSRSGYQFLGWSLDKDGGELNTDYTKNTNWVRLEDDVTLYAQWKEYTYTVVFDLNGGEGTLPEAVTYTAATKNDTKITVPAADGYTKEGCTLIGWSFNTKRTDLKYNGKLSTSDYAPGAEIPSTKLSTPSKDTTYTIYAVWQKDEVVLTLDMNGGAKGPSGYPKSYSYGDSASLPLQGLSYKKTITLADGTTEDIVGQGYYCEETGKFYKIGNIAAGADGKILMDQDHTVIWVWTYSTVTYMVDGEMVDVGLVKFGYATGPDEPTKIIDGPEQDHKRFLGWAEEEDGEITYNPGDSYDGVRDLVLYGVYEDIATLTYDLNGGEGEIEAVTEAVGTEITVADAPTREGYRFEGWLADDEAGTVYQAGDTLTLEADMTLTAQWAKLYTVTYDLNGGEGEIEPITAAVGTEITVADAPTREGYTFTGWLAVEGKAVSAKAPEEGTVYQPGDTLVLPGDITLVAQWEINKYTVTYEDGFGKTLYTEEVEHGSAAQGYSETPTHEGYTFTGWDKELPEAITEDVTITAQWEINKYTVTYVDGFGKTLHTEEVEYGQAAQGYTGTPTHEGKTFKGWDKKLPEKITEDITITALWEPIVFTVKYVDGFGKTLYTEKVEYGQAAQGYTGTPTHEGKTFKGWDKKLPEKITEDITITALWEGVKCTVIYRDGFGTNLYVKTVEYGGSVKPYGKIPTHPGFIFTCWDKKLPEKITEDIIITALWRVDVNVPFTMFVASDLRIAGEGENAENFQKMVQFAIENRGDVTALVTTGNLVDRADDRAAWRLARNTVKTLPKYMYYYGVAGESDVNGDALLYDEYLQPGLNDASDLNFYASGRIWYQRSSREQLMLMGIGYQKMPQTARERDQQAAWIQFVNDAVRIHAGYSVVLLVSDYMDADGELTEFGKLLEEKIVSVNPNIRLVLCGNAEGSARLEKTYADGHTVNALLFNYGADKENGVGFLRKLNFNLTDRSVVVSTYSPILDRTAYDEEHPEDDSFVIEHAF